MWGAEAFSESGCGVFRIWLRRFPNVSAASSNRAVRFVNVAVAFSNLFAECDVAPTCHPHGLAGWISSKLSLGSRGSFVRSGLVCCSADLYPTNSRR